MVRIRRRLGVLVAILAAATGGAAPVSQAAGSGPLHWEAAVEGDGGRASICLPGTPGPACLSLSCAGPGAAMELSYTEPGTMPGIGTLTLEIALDGGAPHAVPVRLEASAGSRRGRVALDTEGQDALKASLRAAGTVEISNGEAVWSAAVAGTEAAFARLAEACSARPAPPSGPISLAGLHGTVQVVLDAKSWPEASGTIKALVTGAHGWHITTHNRLFDARATIPAARAYNAGPGRYLLFAELCGAGDWFGPGGCGIHVSQKIAGHWETVTVRPRDDALRLETTGAAAGGWPAILGADGRRWVWTGAGYRPGL